MKATINIDVGERPIGGLVAATKPRCEVTVTAEGSAEDLQRAVICAKLAAEQLCEAVGIVPVPPRVTVAPPRDPGKPTT